MSSGSWNVEIESQVDAARLFKASMLDWHNLGPKVAPDVLASATGVEGDGGVGSIRQLNFTSGQSKLETIIKVFVTVPKI